MATVAGQMVVGYDGSDTAREAIRRASAIREPGAPMTVVHVFEVPFQVDAYPWFADFRDAFWEVSEEVLDSARELAGDDGGAIRYEAVEGKPAVVLVRRARELDADLIVVGSRGMGRVRSAIGSVTLRLLHETPCPVLVVPAPADAS
jgi:nucleotide-binding universal stress UspA family protein